MSQPSLLLFGATGRVGQRVARDLASRGLRPRCGVRSLERGRELFGDSVELVVADMADPDSLKALARPGDRVFVMSPIHPAMVNWQQAAIRAAAGKASRIVKLSGSTWTQDPAHPTFSGQAHAAIEKVLGESGIPAVCVRPGVFTEGFLRAGLDRLRQGHANQSVDTLALPMGEARVAFADLETIAAACTQLLLADAPATGHVEVTFPESVDGVGLAAMASRALGKAVHYQPMAVDRVVQAQSASLGEFDLTHLRQMLEGIGAGRAAAVAGPTVRKWAAGAVASLTDYVASRVRD